MAEEYMSTDKQYEGQLIDQYFTLKRIRAVAVRNASSDEVIRAIDQEIGCIRLKLRPLELPEDEQLL